MFFPAFRTSWESIFSAVKIWLAALRKSLIYFFKLIVVRFINVLCHPGLLPWVGTESTQQHSRPIMHFGDKTKQKNKTKKNQFMIYEENLHFGGVKFCVETKSEKKKKKCKISCLKIFPIWLSTVKMSEMVQNQLKWDDKKFKLKTRRVLGPNELELVVGEVLGIKSSYLKSQNSWNFFIKLKKNSNICNIFLSRLNWVQ